MREHCPAILKVYGCGVITAAELLVSSDENPERFKKGESSFARRCGVAPIPASTGKTTGRTGPDRDGDRTANKVLHQIVLSGLSHDEDTKDYVKRRMRGGDGQRSLSKREAIRCLKRYVAREVYWAITHPFGEPQASLKRSVGPGPQGGSAHRRHDAEGGGCCRRDRRVDAEQDRVGEDQRTVQGGEALRLLGERRDARRHRGTGRMTGTMLKTTTSRPECWPRMLKTKIKIWLNKI